MLKVEHLEKILSDNQNTFKLQDITFSLPKGYICGLIGENGAGKTSLIKSLIGLYRLDQGNVYVDGMNLAVHEAAVKDMLGLVLDESYYDIKMTLEQIGIFYGALYSKFSMDQYLEKLEEFQLDKKQKFKSLSKGMRIKVQLAFALSYDAKMFLFDEPTAGLDQNFREEFLKLCTELVSDGEKSVLVSSHITEDLDQIADYIAYMQKGKMLFFESKEILCDRFLIVKGENYKCKLLPKEAVVHMEQGEYSSSAMVVNSRRLRLDETLEKHRPNIREFMYYFVKGGSANAENIAEKYLQSNN